MKTFLFFSEPSDLEWSTCMFFFPHSVSSALDEAATALTRMKSDRQTYEAFLRGANQAPSPSPIHPTAPPVQHQPPSTTSTGAQSVPTTGEKFTGKHMCIVYCSAPSRISDGGGEVTLYSSHWVIHVHGIRVVFTFPLRTIFWLKAIKLW